MHLDVSSTRSCHGWSTASEPIERSTTPPSQWYFGQHSYERDLVSVFGRGWRLAEVAQLQPETYKAGSLSSAQYLLVADEQGQTRGFHNVCRHHAALVASGHGKAPTNCVFQCPYHGWTYDRQGRLIKATRLKGIKGFKAKDNGLIPIPVSQWARRFTFLNLGGEFDKSKLSLDEWIGEECSQMLTGAGVADDDLVHIKSHTYAGIRCNWKVFCDNYLDGGYHVSVAHPRLASGLDLDQYFSKCFANASVQSCLPACDDRLGTSKLAYAFIFPNVMINRYGPWMDVNVVTPTGPTTCDVKFDWWIAADREADEAFITRSLEESDQVQQEDIALCESVQRGLESPAYQVGRYAPSLEQPMLHFHRLLHECYDRA